VDQDGDQTRIGTGSVMLGALADQRVHYLEVLEGLDIGKRYAVHAAGLTIGRSPPADIVLADSEVSRAHCRVALAGEELLVTDLRSTNGTFLDGVRLSSPTRAPLGAVLRVGRQILKHESRNARELAQTAELDRELEKANAYVQALLPPPITQGPVRCDWVHQPSTRLGGDAFGYSQLADGIFIGYLIDVSGHGAGAALHAVSILNVLSRRALPNADMTDPGQVLAALNAMFPMESCADMFFTMWYGVYHVAERRLTYASAGHHPAFLVAADRATTQPLATPNPVIGAIDRAQFQSATIEASPGSTLYVFSDGVFEITTREGAAWSLDDFLPLMQHSPTADYTESQRLLRAVRNVAIPGGFEDDFTMVVLKFL
jgi:serine phosphatase RsbU (regulator of sigma subunit)